jgi:hypothetical protein
VIGEVSNAAITNAPFAHQFRIVDDDQVRITLTGPLAVAEGAAPVTYTATLERGVLPGGEQFGFEGGQITVNIAGGAIGHAAVQGTGTLQFPEDYRIDNTTLTFSGDSLSESVQFTVTINDDDFVEANEMFTLSVSSPTLQGLNPSQVQYSAPLAVTLTDNDSATIELIVLTNNIHEGAGLDHPFVLGFDWVGKPADTTVAPRFRHRPSPAPATPATGYFHDGIPVVFPAFDVTTKLTEFYAPNEDQIVEPDQFFDVILIGLNFGDGQTTRAVTIGPSVSQRMRVIDND